MTLPTPPNPFVPGAGLVGSGIVAAVSTVLHAFVSDVVHQLGTPLTAYLLHTPDLLAEPTLRRLWLVTLGCLAAVAGLLLAVAGAALVTGATRAGLAAREAVSSRLLGCLATAAVSLPLVATEASLANRLVDAVLPGGGPAASDGLWRELTGTLSAQPSAGLALLVTEAVLVVLLAGLAVLALARWASVWLLVVLAPLAMGAALLPSGADVARAWWRLQAVAVFLPVGHAALLATYAAMYGSRLHGLSGALAGIAVVALMGKLPRWALGVTSGLEAREVLAPVRRGGELAGGVAGLVAARRARASRLSITPRPEDLTEAEEPA